MTGPAFQRRLNFQIGVLRGRRIASSGMLARVLAVTFNFDGLTCGLCSVFARAFRAYLRADDPSTVDRLHFVLMAGHYSPSCGGRQRR